MGILDKGITVVVITWTLVRFLTKPYKQIKEIWSRYMWIHNWLENHIQRGYQWLTLKLAGCMKWDSSEVCPVSGTIQYFN